MSWHNAKVERARQIGGWFCEDCGETLTPMTAVGHHERYRRNGGKSEARNCRLRCGSCEQHDPHTNKSRQKKIGQSETRAWKYYCQHGRLPRWR